jgi:signal peptidase II
VNFALNYNRGAAFSLGSGESSLIVVIAVVLAIAVLAVSGRLARAGASVVSIVALGLLSGGAVSNLVDRFVGHDHGGVVDFVQLVSWWPVFNLADASITVGAVALAASLLFRPLPDREVRSRPGSTDQ